MYTAFPFSAGNAAALTRLPPGACDCHFHLYDARVPTVPGATLCPPDASMDDYRRVQQRMGTTRAVQVTPSTYGTNNTLLLEGLQQLGDAGRGVAVIAGDEPDDVLQALHRARVRGARINLSVSAIHDPASIATIARRIAPLGWHLQLLMPVAQLLALAPQLPDLQVDLVFDHFGRIVPGDDECHAAHDLLLRLLASRRAWIKLSGGYLVSPLKHIDDPALDALAKRFIDAAPDRVLWGSDWPHATASAGHSAMPDDARQIDRLAQWAGSTARLQQILVTNPERLYGFSCSAH